MEIQTPAPIVMIFCLHILTWQRRFWCRFDPCPLAPLGQGGAKTLKAEGHIFGNYLQNKRCSAGCKLTGAVPGYLS